MLFKSITYGNRTLLLALVLCFWAPSVAKAQLPALKSPNQLRAFYVQAIQRNLAANATDTFVYLLWNGPSAESDTTCVTTWNAAAAESDTVCTHWMGYRVRRTIVGITPVPMGVVGQWKARDSVVPLCVEPQVPCDLANFIFTGTGIFFKGFRNNRVVTGSGATADTTYLLDYPPGSPADVDSSARLFVDLSAIAGFTTQYSVTSIDTLIAVNADFYESPMDTAVTVVPATPPAQDMTLVAVVPNPYRGHAQWDPAPGERRMHFIHLPAGSIVRIYTPNGELIRTLEQNAGSSPGGVTGELEWDMQNGAGREVATGIYLYTVSPPDGRTPVRGHFVIIK